jgi:L-amino acid N-acyltransferase YncA
MSQKAVIREAELSDAASIAQIYNAYIQTSTITFEEEAVTPEEMARRIGDVRAGGLPWYLSIAEGEVAGYAYATRWRPRSAYGLSVEVTVYVAQAYTGRGIGTDLYERVLGMLKERGFHTAIAGIALPNLKSITLHQRFGFVKVAHFSQVGFKLGRWVDVGYWQLML